MTARQPFTEKELHDLALPTLNILEICTGVGMLGEGLRAGLQHLGIAHRAVGYLEREAYPASVLAARCQEGSLDDAPVWSDLLTFDGAAFNGAVDGIAAGFPCQDLSLAGRRAGLDGKRSGLFFNILDIADACGAWFLFLENVAGIVSATASVVDEAEGDLEERAAARVLGELADRGWNAEWLTLSASDVGASHGRERWFCFAWRQSLDDSERTEWREACAAGIGCQQGDDGGRPEAHGRAGESVEILGDSNQQRKQQPNHQDRTEPRCDARACAGGPGVELGNTESQRRGEARQCDAQADDSRSGGAVSELADPTGHGWHQGRTEPGREQGRPDAAERSGAVANASSPRQQGRELGRALHGNRGGKEAHGPVEQLRRPFFAPGPSDQAWAGIIQQWPERAPALEPYFHGVADGMAYAMDESRAQRLKCCGNGVVALCAAVAFVHLARRAGLTA